YISLECTKKAKATGLKRWRKSCRSRKVTAIDPAATDTKRNYGAFYRYLLECFLLIPDTAPIYCQGCHAVSQLFYQFRPLEICLCQGPRYTVIYSCRFGDGGVATPAIAAGRLILI